MARLTYEADYGLEEWEQTLYQISVDTDETYNILDLADRYTGDSDADCGCILQDISVKLKRYEDMQERITKKIADLKRSSNYPHNFIGQMVEDFEWVLNLLNLNFTGETDEN